MGHDVFVAFTALKAVYDVLFLRAHVGVFLLAVVRRKPAFFLPGEQVEFFQQFHVFENKMRRALFEKSYREILGVDISGVLSGLGDAKNALSIAGPVRAPAVQKIKDLFDVPELRRDPP